LRFRFFLVQARFRTFLIIMKGSSWTQENSELYSVFWRIYNFLSFFDYMFYFSIDSYQFLRIFEENICFLLFGVLSRGETI
jgi:hypothetical protein